MSAEDRRPVVAAVDGQPGSAGALQYAVDEAIRSGAPLRLVHVCPGPEALTHVVGSAELRAEGCRVLDRSVRTARTRAPELQVSTELVVGPRAAGILSAARGGRLLVVGRSPRHRVEVPGGGTPAAVATRAPCPTVVVPSTWTAAAARRPIVVAMKSRTHARELLSHAFDIAESRGAGVIVVTAWELYDPTMDREEARENAAEWEADGTAVLEELVAEWRRSYPTVPVDVRVAHGRAVSVLEHASAEADLLLIARRQHFVPPYGRLGRTADTLLRTSRSPVEVVPIGVVAAVPAMSSSG